MTDLSKAGFGMISLSVYRDPDDKQYAAVWINRPMPSWSAIHGVDGNAYQALFNKDVKAGFQLLRVECVLVCASVFYLVCGSGGLGRIGLNRHTA